VESWKERRKKCEKAVSEEIMEAPDSSLSITNTTFGKKHSKLVKYNDMETILNVIKNKTRWA
jgi:hypothetical protein